MGTDVHMIGEYYDKFYKKWVAFPIPDYFTNRNYGFFAALGNVRNGFGFAGVKTFTPIEPLTDCRGVPSDLSSIGKMWADDDLDYDGSIYEVFAWPGDHSWSYCTLDEIIKYKWPRTERTGVVPIDEYKKLNGANPESWSGGVSGKNIITIDQEIVDKYEPVEGEVVYVQMRWEDDLVNPKFVGDFISFLSFYKQWDAEDSDVRIIFGFDS